MAAHRPSLHAEMKCLASIVVLLLLYALNAAPTTRAQSVMFTLVNNMNTYECDVTIDNYQNAEAHVVLATDGGTVSQELGTDPGDAWNNHDWGITVLRDYTDPNSPLVQFDPLNGMNPDQGSGLSITLYYWEAEFEGFFLTLQFSDGTISARTSQFGWN